MARYIVHDELTTRRHGIVLLASLGRRRRQSPDVCPHGGNSGSHGVHALHRPALDRLLADCQKRLVDAVVVYRYDRFARSLRQLVNALDEFRALGIDFVSLHESLDTSTPNGRLVFGIFASIAEFERELIRDRVRSGLALARARANFKEDLGDDTCHCLSPQYE